MSGMLTARPGAASGLHERPVVHPQNAQQAFEHVLDILIEHGHADIANFAAVVLLPCSS